ncbi:hypothetical protein BGZ76_000517, partial [Entomortierella beljakovae]
MNSAIILRVTLALALVAVATQAAPLSSIGDIDPTSDLGGFGPNAPCSQNVDSGSTLLESTVNAIPITNITPIHRYRPVIQSFAPIVQSQCGQITDDLFDSSFESDGSPYLNEYDGYNNNLSRRDMTPSDFPQDVIVDASFQPSSDAIEPNYNMDLQQEQEQEQESCDTMVPQQNIDLGSLINMIPSTNVAPSTLYEPQVQSLESNIQATPSQLSSLPQQNVNLGSDVDIQPSTHVFPQTVYEPEVHQLTAAIAAAPQQDQSLAQSSVQLGSHVQIVPAVNVQPFTVYQPRVQSLPAIVEAQPCGNTFLDNQLLQGDSSTVGPISGTDSFHQDAYGG